MFEYSVPAGVITCRSAAGTACPVVGGNPYLFFLLLLLPVIAGILIYRWNRAAERAAGKEESPEERLLAGLRAREERLVNKIAILDEASRSGGMAREEYAERRREYEESLAGVRQQLRQIGKNNGP